MLKKEKEMTASKIRSNVYLDVELKESAKKLFKSYGLSLSDGLNILLRKATKEEFEPFPFEIEPIYPNDPDYKLVEQTRSEKRYSLDEVMKEFNVN